MNIPESALQAARQVTLDYTARRSDVIPNEEGILRAGSPHIAARTLRDTASYFADLYLDVGDEPIKPQTVIEILHLLADQALAAQADTEPARVTVDTQASS